MAKIEIYSTLKCPYCIRAKQLLHNKGATYTEILIDKDPSKLPEMLQRSNGRRSVPQIFIDGKGIGGYDELCALDQDGMLDTMLNR